MLSTSGDDVSVMAKGIGAVRDEEMFKVLCRNPTEKFSVLQVDLLSIALEEYRANPKSGAKDSAFKADGKEDNAMANYIDRVIHGVKKIPGYGNRSRSLSPYRRTDGSRDNENSHFRRRDCLFVRKATVVIQIIAAEHKRF